MSIKRKPRRASLLTPRFDGYVMRFGQIEAQFTTGNLIQISAGLERFPAMPIAIVFYSKRGLRKHVKELRASGGQTWKRFQAILDKFPDNAERLPPGWSADPGLPKPKRKRKLRLI